jgi:glycosyltransferase involved in cell wall biosynthesis
MRIVFLGPATVHLGNWLEEFSRAGLDLTLITFHRDRHFAARYPVIDLSSRHAKKLNLLVRAPQVRREIASRSPDLVVAYYASSYGFLARIASPLPYIVVTAGSDINLTRGRHIHLFPMVKHALSGAARIICWSETMKGALERFRVPDSKVYVLPRGVPLGRFRNIDVRSDKGLRFRMICLRRFRRIFHHDTLVEACRLLAARGVSFELLLCSDGPERQRIEALVARHGLSDRIRFLGDLQYAAVPELLAQAHVYVALAEIDGASASLFEAMCAGAFPVVSDIAANRLWIRHGVNGMLVDYRDPVQVADAIEQCRTNWPAASAAILDNRRIAESTLDIERNGRRFMELFREVAGGLGAAQRMRAS